LIFAELKMKVKKLNIFYFKYFIDIRPPLPFFQQEKHTPRLSPFLENGNTDIAK